MTFLDIPLELREARQWVNRTGRDGKKLTTPKGISSEWQRPDNWSSFEEVVKAAPDYVEMTKKRISETM